MQTFHHRKKAVIEFQFQEVEITNYFEEKIFFFNLKIKYVVKL